MRLEITVDIPIGTSSEFVLSLQDWLGVRLVRWRVIEGPDPNEEHSGEWTPDPRLGRGE